MAAGSHSCSHSQSSCCRRSPGAAPAGRAHSKRSAAFRTLIGLLLLLLALGAGLLSRGVADAARQFRGVQPAWQQGLGPHPPSAATWIDGVGADLLGIRVRSEILRTYLEYRLRLWFATSDTLFRQNEARADAVDRMRELAPSLPSADRSQVDTTICVLAAINAAASGPERQQLLSGALDSCRQAIGADSRNTGAKRDLELLLRQSQKTQGAQARPRNAGSRSKKDQNKPAATPHTQKERRIGY